MSFLDLIFPPRCGGCGRDGVAWCERCAASVQPVPVTTLNGTPLVAARGGRVQWRAYQASGAGYYLVIDGKKTGHDWMYAHLKRRSHLRQGQRVRTGQRIGVVGQTGDATACHLHIEEWSAPGWYQGGHFLKAITKHLRHWDRWS